VSKTKTRISKLGTVVIPVSDQDRAIEFYVETLGFEKRTDVPLLTTATLWVEGGAGRRDDHDRHRPAAPPASRTGNVETGIGLTPMTSMPTTPT